MRLSSPSPPTPPTFQFPFNTTNCAEINQILTPISLRSLFNCSKSTPRIVPSNLNQPHIPPFKPPNANQQDNVGSDHGAKPSN